MRGSGKELASINMFQLSKQCGYFEGEFVIQNKVIPYFKNTRNVLNGIYDSVLILDNTQKQAIASKYCLGNGKWKNLRHAPKVPG